jgi:hypothetical protein
MNIETGFYLFTAITLALTAGLGYVYFAILLPRAESNARSGGFRIDPETNEVEHYGDFLTK